jgi:hypothetical protein
MKKDEEEFPGLIDAGTLYINRVPAFFTSELPPFEFDDDEAVNRARQRIADQVANAVNEAAVYGTRSSDGAPALPARIKSVKATTPIEMLHGDGAKNPWEIVGDRHIQMDVDTDTICIECGRLLIEHTVDVGDGLMSARFYPGRGFAHKLCILEEAEIVEIKSLPSSTGEHHGEASETVIAPDA